MDGKGRLGFRLEYLALRLVLAGLARAPRAAGRALGRLVGRVLGRRTRLAAGNMAKAFPGASAGQIVRWVREMWENLGEAAWEFSRLGGLSRAGYFEWVKVEGVERLRDSLALGKGVVLFTPHFTNWELTSQFVPHSGFPLAVIARRIKNPFVNDWINGVRAAAGIRVMLHKNAVRESIRWLKGGGVLGLLFDQRITDGGAAVSFFGRPAHTTTLPALLALRLGCPVHPVVAWREAEGVRLVVEPAMDFTGLEAREQDILKATALMTARIEDWVRRRPPLWLWIHDRWKP